MVELRGGISKVLTIVIAVVLLVMVSSAVFYLGLVGPSVTPSTGPTSSTSGRTSTPRDTIVVGTVGQVGSTLDPALAGSPLATNLIRNLGAGLIDLAPRSGKVVPALAESWTSSGGGMIWTFHLRHGLSFPDGSPFNASDAAQSINRSMGYGRGSFAAKGYAHLVLGAIVIDNYTLQILLGHSSSVDFAADTSLFAVKPAIAFGQTIVNYTGKAETENPNGLGPFLLSDWVKTGGRDQSVNLMPNPHYWNRTGVIQNSSGTLKNVTVFYFGDKTSMLASLESGGVDSAYVDVAYGGLLSADVQKFALNPAYIIWTGPGALGGSNSAVSSRQIGGVVLDQTGFFRYYLLAKS